MKRDKIRQWFRLMGGQRHMDKLNLKAMNFVRKQEMIKKKMIIFEIRKYVNKEKLWLQRVNAQFTKTKQNRQLVAWRN
jgi:hypothetical protein